MHRFAAILAVGTTLVWAQTLDQVPQCAQDCLLSPGALPADCPPGDFACICGNADFVDRSACCVYGTCAENEISSVIDLATSFCSGVGVEVAIPDGPPTDCPDDSAGSSSSASDDDSSSTAAPTSTASDDDSSASETASAPTTTETGDDDSDDSSASESSPSESAPAASESAPAPADGAAGRVEGGLAAVAAGLVAVLAI